MHAHQTSLNLTVVFVFVASLFAAAFAAPWASRTVVEASREAALAVEAAGTKTGAGHEVVSCAGSETALPVISTADYAGTANGHATEFTAVALTDSPAVYLYSKNGEAYTEGYKLCTGGAAGCVSSISINTASNLWNCRSDGSAQNIQLGGTR